jgi:hypothetical protein
MLPTAAYSKATILKRSGGWVAFHVDAGSEGRPLCGMMINSRSNERSLMIKYQADGGVFIQVFKTSWRFKPDIKVNVWIRFDDGAPRDGIATTEVTDSGNPLLGVRIKPGAEADFLHEVAESNKLTIGFPDGDEEPWVANMTGSREIALTLSKCAAHIDGKGAATQPTPKAAPTQPFGKSAAPTQPTTRRAPKSDDSSI